MGDLNNRYKLRSISLGEMFSQEQIIELHKYVNMAVLGDWSHVKSFLARKEIEQHLLDQNILPEYLLRFLQYKISQDQAIPSGMNN